MTQETITITKELFDAMVDHLFDLPRRDTSELFLHLAQEMTPEKSPIIIN